MSRAVLILGESGTGKSTSIRNLNPEETVIINVVGKELPFRGSKTKYPLYDKEQKKGNMFVTDNPEEIVKLLKALGNSPKIKNIVIDDAQHIIMYEYIRRAKEKGFDKYNDLAQHIFNVVDAGKNLRSDITIFFLWHTEVSGDEFGNKFIKAKTAGKLLDNAIKIESLFTVVLLTDIVRKDKEVIDYGFVTKSDGTNTAKSPIDMFDYRIPNDLKYVIDKMNEYETGE